MSSWFFFHRSCQPCCVMWCSWFNVHWKKNSVWHDYKKPANPLSISIRRQLHAKSSFCVLEADIWAVSYYTNIPWIYQLEYIKNPNFYSVFFNYIAWPGEGIEFYCFSIFGHTTCFSNKVTSPFWLPDEIMYSKKASNKSCSKLNFVQKVRERII